MTVSRNKSYEILIGVIYDFLIAVDMNEEVDVEKTMSDAFNVTYADIDVLPKEIAIQTIKNFQAIVKTFQAAMPTWRFERLNRLIQAILLMSYANYTYVKNIDKAVVINIAIKLAKRYGDANDYKFVNAILDNVLK